MPSSSPVVRRIRETVTNVGGSVPSLPAQSVVEAVLVGGQCSEFVDLSNQVGGCCDEETHPKWRPAMAQTPERGTPPTGRGESPLSDTVFARPSRLGGG